MADSSPCALPGTTDVEGPAGTIPLDATRPLYRRIGRRALRWLRPAAAPLLHRLEWRVGAALDGSRTADAVGALSEKTLRREALHSIEEQIAALRAEIDGMFAELRAELMLRLDALSLSQFRAHTLSSGLAALEDRLAHRQRNAVEALRADLQALAARGAELSAQRDALTEKGFDGLVESTDRLLQRWVVPLGMEVAVRTDYGYLLVPAEDEKLLFSMVETAGRLEAGTLAVIVALLRPGDFVLDVGANVGTLCLPAARRVGPGGRVLAIEPTPRTAAVLRRSLALNAVEEWVEVLQSAAGEAEGQGRLAVSSTLTHNSLLPLEDTSDHVEVTIRPLDACVPQGQVVDLVKLDVEGAELQAWRGMQRIIADSPRLAVIVEFGPSHLQRGGISIADWLRELQAPGFTAWEIEEPAGRLRPLRQDGLADVFSINLLLLREPPAERPGLRLA